MDIIFLWPTLNCVHVVDVWICPPIINNIAKKNQIHQRMDDKKNAGNNIQMLSKYIILFVITTNESWVQHVCNNTNHESMKRIKILTSISRLRGENVNENDTIFVGFFFVRAKNASLWTWLGHIKVMTRVRLLYQCTTMDYWESINASKETHFLVENTSGHTNFHKELSKKHGGLLKKSVFREIHKFC